MPEAPFLAVCAVGPLRWPRASAIVLATGMLVGAAATASPQLAMDKGCWNCHGPTPKSKAPTFAQLAQRYEKFRGDSAQLHLLADQLREGRILGHVSAHERLDHETAEQLVIWIANGAR